MGTGTRRTPAVRRFRRSSPLGRPGRFLKLLTALLAGSLLAGLMALIPAAVAGAASTSSEASEAFVAVGGSSPELEAVDTTSGSLVGSPVALSYVPTGVVEYASSPHAVPEIVEVVVAEGSSSEEASVQAVDPTTETSSAAVCLLSDCADAAPGQVAAADVSSSAQYVLVLLPSLDELAVVDVDSSPVAVSQLLSLGFSSGGSPSGIAVSHDGSVAYVTDKGSNQLKTLFYDSSSTPFEVEHTYSGSAGFDPTSLVIDRETNQALISDGSNLDIATLSSGEMTGVTSQVSLSGCGSSVTAGSVVLDALGTNAYVQLASADSVADVTVATGAVTCLSPGFSPGPLALTDDGGTLAVTASSSASLGLYSTQASYVGDLENSVSLSATPVAIASAADLSLDREAYVALGPSGELAMVDLTTDALDQTVDLGTGTDPDAVAVSPDGQFVYVADYGTNEVSVVQTDLMDSPDDPVVATVSLPSGSEPDSLAVSPDGDQLLAADYGTGKVSVIDTEAGSGYLGVSNLCTVSPCSSSTEPVSVALSPDGSRAYVALAGDDDLSIIDQSAGSYSFQATEASLFTHTPDDLVVSPDDQMAYASLSNGHLAGYKIDPADGELVDDGNVALGSGTSYVSLSPNGTTAYFLSQGTSEVYEVETSSIPSETAIYTQEAVTASPESIAAIPGGINFVTTSSSSTSPLSVYSDTGGSSGASVDLGDYTGSQAVAVSPFFDDPAPESPVGFEDDTNPAVSATSGIDTQDGVDTATGGYTYNQDLLSLPDIGISLDLSVEYDSATASTNPESLGYGWSFSYGMHATQPSSGPDECDLVVTQENGTPVVFYPPPYTGSCSTDYADFQPASFEQATISVVADCNGDDSCWDVTRDGTDQYLFDETTGDLVSETDPNGNTVSLSYSSDSFTVTGQSGVRQLTVDYNAAGDVTRVTDSAERTASFAYSSGNLTSITVSATSTGDPESHEWLFGYGSGHEMSDWWSPDNESTQSSYPCSGAASFNDDDECEATQVAYSSGVVTAVAAPEWSTECSGDSGTPYCMPETTFSYPSMDATTGDGTVLVSDPDENYDTSAGINGGDGNTTLDTYTDGVLTSQAEGYGYESSMTSPYDQYPMAPDVTYALPDPYSFLPAANLDGDGDLTQTSYDAAGNAIETIDPLGNVTTDIYNKFGEVTQETDPLGNVTSSAYDSHGNEISTTDPDGDVTSYAYNSYGEQCAMLSPDGYAAGDTLASCPGGAEPYVTAYGYDAEGDQTSVTQYDGTDNTATETYVSSSLYNSAGEVCATLSADGTAAGDSLPDSCPGSGAGYESVNVDFDAFGNVLESISPSNAPGGTTTSAYDGDGNQISSTDPAGDTTTSAYNPDDQVCWTEPLSVDTASCGSPPTGTGTETTTYEYDPSGNQVASVAPDGNEAEPSCLYETTSSFDNLGNTLSTATPTGGTTCGNETTSTTSSTYDADGNVITSTDGTGTTTTSAYDGDGNLCWSETADVTDPSCSSPPTGAGTTTTSYEYDADGNQTETVPPDGNASGTPSYYATTTTYDGDGNVTSQTTPLAGDAGSFETTTDTYDQSGNEVTVTDPEGGDTDNTYDEQGRELSTKDPSGHVTSYTYDADGTVLTTTVQGGSAGTSTYNGAGQVTRTTYSDGTPTVSYQYGANGQVCWMYQGTSTAACGSPPSGATTYSYDSSGQLTAETNAAGATDTYGYDASRNLDCVSYPNTDNDTCSSEGTPAGVVRYVYNASNQLTSLTDWAGDTLTFSYDASGQECWVSTYAPATPTCDSPPQESGAVTTAYSYDPLGNVADIATTTGTAPSNLLSISVGLRDADNDIEQETPTVGDTTMATDDYSYDDSEQVTSGPIAGSSGDDTYTYSSLGSIRSDTTAFQYSGYSANGELCWTYAGSDPDDTSCSPPTGSGETTYAYNSDGERTGMTPDSGDPASYGWEKESGLLTCANTDGTTCSTGDPTATTTVYTYDGNGLRTSATTGGTTTNYTWGTAQGSQLLSDGTWDYVYAGGASPIEQIATTEDSPTVDLLLSDESGNARGLAQLSSGTYQDDLVNYTDYDAYGNPITQAGGGAEAGGISVPQTGIDTDYIGSTSWGFGEGYTDSTGFIYLVRRYYDPQTSQFMSVDSLSSETQQPYEYASDNPTTNADPTGSHSQVKVGPPAESGCTTSIRWHTGWSWFQYYDWIWLNPCLNSYVIAGSALVEPALELVPSWVTAVVAFAVFAYSLGLEIGGLACGTGAGELKGIIFPIPTVPIPYPYCDNGGWTPSHPNMSGQW